MPRAYRLGSLGMRPFRETGRNAFEAMDLADQQVTSVAISRGGYNRVGEAASAARLRGTSFRDQEWDRGSLTESGGESSSELIPGANDPTQDYVPGDSEPAVGNHATGAWTRFSSYDVLGVIREGGMSVVYKARQRGLNRLVALKMIRGKEWSRPDHLVRLQIEAESVAKLRHPNIVQIHEIGEVDGLPFLSLEFLEGGTLEDQLAGNPQSGRAAAELIATLARAIQACGHAGIIHRDLKPSNVLFTSDGTPRITDFGLAKDSNRTAGKPSRVRSWAHPVTWHPSRPWVAPRTWVRLPMSMPWGRFSTRC